MPSPVALSPWTPHWAVRAEALIADLHAAAPGGWLAIETQRKQLVEAPEHLTLDAERDTGPARLTLFRS